MVDGKYRNWCFTAYSDSVEYDTKGIQFMVYQREVCPETKKEHWQGYVEFKGQKRMGEVKKVFNDNTIHLEARYGTQKQAIDYCMKSDSRKEGCKPISYGKPKNQGNRSDLDSLWDAIESGMTQREILLEHQGKALKYINMIYKGAKVFHECCSLDSFIKSNRNASEVGGNTEPPTDLDDIVLKKDIDRIDRWEKGKPKSDLTAVDQQ